MTEESTQVEQAPEANMPLGEALKQAYKDAENAVNTQENDEEVQKAQEESTQEKEVANALQEDENQEAEEEIEEQDDIAEEVEKEFSLIPKEMSPDEQEAFKALLESDDEDKRLAAEIFIERYNNLKKGFYKKTQKYAEDTKEYKDINNVFAPYEQSMSQKGITKAQYVKAMVDLEAKFNQDPIEATKLVMQRYNVKPEQIAPRDTTFDDDFDFDGNNEIKELKSQIDSLRNQLSEQQQQPVIQQIEQFAKATDSEGKLLHPHFENVKTLMGSLIQSGQATDLTEAYSKATRTIDVEEPTASVDLDKIRKRVANAKKARKGVKTSGVRPDFSKMTVKDELKARLNSNL